MAQYKSMERYKFNGPKALNTPYPNGSIVLGDNQIVNYQSIRFSYDFDPIPMSSETMESAFFKTSVGQWLYDHALDVIVNIILDPKTFRPKLSISAKLLESDFTVYHLKFSK